jgi:hypothetical protein
MLPKSSVTYASLPSISVSASRQKNLFRSSFVHCPGPPCSGTLCITSTPPPHHTPNPLHPPNGKNSFSRLLFSVFQSSFSIHYHYSILHSSFFFSRNTKADPNHSCPPPPCRYVGMCCVRMAFWFGFRQSGITRLLSSSFRTITFAHHWQ